MNILITGGAGFIGSHLSEKIIDLGHRVICVDNFNDYYDPAIKENNIKGIIDNDNYKLYRADILDRQAIGEIFSASGIDLVIHLAARAGVRPSLANAALYEKVNVGGTINLLENCRERGINRFIFASSSSVYGGNKKIPFSETDRVDCPVSHYAATKKSGELICYTYHHLYNISVFAFRFFTVYGPRQRPEMAVHKFSGKILAGKPIELYGDGTSSRDYTYIDDIISGITNSLEFINGYEIINLGNSKPVGLSRLVGLIEDAVGKKALVDYKDPQPGDVFTTYADIKKARRLIKYRPETPIEKGIGYFIEWYKTKKKEGILNDR
ncbi:MAG: GDP-mannose 4,6-dehydratase [Actinobacteria bacterium]|nr:GDP-mannose 4,6-dehydratase [Actinomycetota bacterium]